MQCSTKAGMLHSSEVLRRDSGGVVQVNQSRRGREPLQLLLVPRNTFTSSAAALHNGRHKRDAEWPLPIDSDRKSSWVKIARAEFERAASKEHRLLLNRA